MCTNEQWMKPLATNIQHCYYYDSFQSQGDDKEQEEEEEEEDEITISGN